MGSEPAGDGTDAPRIPGATYRLQFNRSFTFRRATELVSYLRDLGVTDVYASPFLAAQKGSEHGYNVVDPTRVNPDLGTENELGAFVEALRRRDMGLIADIVPNHMCVTDPANLWWADVLENGASSPYARFFDIDWRPLKIDLWNKVLLPFLGDQFGKVLENRQIRLVLEDGAFFIRVYENRFPTDPRTWHIILVPARNRLRSRAEPSDVDLHELESILTALNNLPLRTEIEWEKVRERQREKEIIKKRLAALHASSATVRAVLEECLEELNGDRGDPPVVDQLDAMLAAQGYRLAFWRVAADEINYRRFFDINDLAAIRVEDPEVFRAVHRKTLDLIRRGWVSGLRVDHVDGLFDPLQYLCNLQQAAWEARGAGGEMPKRPFYVVVEKVLGKQERLSPDWPVHGTTGYSFLNLLNGLFVDGDGLKQIREIYRRFTGRWQPQKELLATCKKLIMLVSMASELNELAYYLDRISEQHRWFRDFTLETQRFALREAIAWFPVYRSYIGSDIEGIREDDRAHVEEAIREARRHSPATDPSIFEFLRRVWLLDYPAELSDEQCEEWRSFAMRLQQFSGPVMAKGLEDTFYYRHLPLASLNEVGGERQEEGVTLQEFHRWNRERQQLWPHALLATSTHDTKRSEDVRARINLLTEIPGEWKRTLQKWHRMNRGRKTLDEETEAPDANDEYLFYQTLIGTWPLAEMSEEEHAAFISRIEEYMMKAIREAKVHTSWITQNEDYEQGMRRFVRSALERTSGNKFLPDLVEFHAQIRRAGMLNSLVQTVVKIASPGVPDFYQGTEVWNFSLVDPDNRRPVDYATLERLLADLPGPGEGVPAGLVAAPEDGRIKLWVMRTALAFRNERRELFERGTYAELETAGPAADHVVAFSRLKGNQAAVVLTGRFFMKRPHAPGAWDGTKVVLPEALAASKWREGFTTRTIETRSEGGKRTLPLAEVFSDLPIALLEPEA